MFNPLRPALTGLDSKSGDNLENVVVTLLSNGVPVPVTHDGFSIGSSRQCDLKLVEPSIPSLHSIIHIQSGAIWIECADDHVLLLVNDRPCRRMALRNDDRLRIGTTELTVCMQAKSFATVEQSQKVINEDLTLLTAEELCDRILSEQSMVAEFADGQRSGWEALLHAIHAANEETVAQESIVEPIITSDDQQAGFDELLEQIEQLNVAITDRTQELTEREQEVLETSNALDEAKDRVTRRLDEILDQLNQTDPPTELRASA